MLVPAKLAPQLVTAAQAHAEWEVFSKMRLSEGGHLRKYYPLSAAARVEYEAWKKEQAGDKEPTPYKKKRRTKRYKKWTVRLVQQVRQRPPLVICSICQ